MKQAPMHGPHDIIQLSVSSAAVYKEGISGYSIVWSHKPNERV